MAALATLLVETARRCVEALGDEELCRKVITVATEAAVNGRVYVHGKPAKVTAWSAKYEQMHVAASDGGVVLEFTTHGLPSIVIYVTKDRVTTEVIDMNYIAALNQYDENILQKAKKIISET
ncbi:MAG: hypothetical protein ACO2PN_29435 [Pyrobaculum sp.]|jgi:hypothetical protein